MKKAVVVFCITIFCISAIAQDSDNPIKPNITVKWAPTGLLVGSGSLQAEYFFGGRKSLTAKIGLPLTAHHTFTYNNNDADFDMKATSFLAGFRRYLSKDHLRGLYFEPYFKYVHHTSEGNGSGTLNNRTANFNFTNDYNGAGIGAQLGAQFLIGKHFVIDLFFFGPEINSSSNSFTAVEISRTIPWNYLEAKDAEKQVRDFLDQFPFIRNRVNVMVDSDNRRVNAEFKGALPGIRTGISFGYAF